MLFFFCKNIHRENVFMVNIEIGKNGLGILDLGIVKLGKINWENCTTIPNKYH